MRWITCSPATQFSTPGRWTNLVAATNLIEPRPEGMNALVLRRAQIAGSYLVGQSASEAVNEAAFDVRGM